MQDLHLLQYFQSVSDHFVTLSIKGLRFFAKYFTNAQNSSHEISTTPRQFSGII